MRTDVYSEMDRTSEAAGTSAVKPQLTVIEPVKRERQVVKVAAYCRVSTDRELQQNSLDTQIEAFTSIINEHPGWELTNIYADKGISGTLVRRRTEFLRMIEDAKAGKIHYMEATAAFCVSASSCALHSAWLYVAPSVSNRASSSAWPADALGSPAETI